jgi:hypothetical protein
VADHWTIFLLLSHLIEIRPQSYAGFFIWLLRDHSVESFCMVTLLVLLHLDSRQVGCNFLQTCIFYRSFSLNS